MDHCYFYNFKYNVQYAFPESINIYNIKGCYVRFNPRVDIQRQNNSKLKSSFWLLQKYIYFQVQTLVWNWRKLLPLKIANTDLLESEPRVLFVFRWNYHLNVTFSCGLTIVSKLLTSLTIGIFKLSETYSCIYYTQSTFFGIHLSVSNSLKPRQKGAVMEIINWI